MPAFDPLTYRYASRRNVVYAKNAVASAKCWVESVDDWRIASWLNRRSDASR